mgnify:CR=1 FL=1
MHDQSTSKDVIDGKRTASFNSEKQLTPMPHIEDDLFIAWLELGSRNQLRR